MPIRLAFLCLLQVVLSTSAFAQTQSAEVKPARTLWDHNGSVVYLVAKGSSEFYYQEPRPGMLETGARPGSLLFRGNSENGRYVGTAYIFDRHCGQLPYQVSGPILDNYERVVLVGQASRVGTNSRIRGYLTDTLEFKLSKPGEIATRASGQPKQTAVARIFDGKCRGFLEKRRVGILVAPQEEIEKIVEGEGYVVCNLIPGSAETKVLNTCSDGSPCEIDGALRVREYEADVVDVRSVRSWESWKGICYGTVTGVGDGEYSVGVVEFETANNLKVPVRCEFFAESVSRKILAACPRGSICEVRARFDKRPEASSADQEATAMAVIGYVDSVTVKEPPTDVRDSEPPPYGGSKPDTSTSLGLCSAPISDPLRQMIIDTLISGGKHIAPDWTRTIKDEIERDYGSFLKVRDDATVEKVDESTGKIGCAVTYQADLQGLAEKVLEEGATARAQILIRQIAQEGKVISRRLGYTVQKTSGGSLIVSFGLTTSDSAPRRRVAHCTLYYGVRCVIWR